MSIATIFTVVLYQPLLNALMFLYRFLGSDMGMAIIVLTVLIKFVLFYPSLSQLRAQRTLQATQPKLKELQNKHKGDREAYSKAVMRFYKENKVNPFASCLPLLIQLPILIALYRVFIAGVVADPDTGLMVAEQLENLYTPLRDVYSSAPLDTTMFGFVDLSLTRNYILAILAAAATYWQTKMFSKRQPPKEAGSGGKDEGAMASVNKNMTYLMPGITLIFALSFPAGLALYWLVATLFQVGQQHVFLRSHPIEETKQDENRQ